MTKHFNKSSEKLKRRDLRKYPTYNEHLLWIYLRKKKILGERFLREYSIDKFVLDFYCPRLHLAIEIDGPMHFLNEEAILYDKKRQEYVESYGISFLRFRDEEITRNADKVIFVIKEKVKALQKETPPASPLVKGSD